MKDSLERLKTFLFDFRITRVRKIAQAFFFCLFGFLVVITDLRYLGGYPASLFLELDPLVAVATAISTSTVYRGLILSLVILIPSLLLGRFFCSWICPYGTLHQLTAWLLGSKDPKWHIEANRFRKAQGWKYVILILLLVMAAFGSVQVGLFDPLCLFHRSVTTVVLPVVDTLLPERLYTKPFVHVGSSLIGVLLLFLVGMNVVYPRFFCRVLCPLGALLGAAARFSLFRIERDPHKCIDCDLRLKRCQGASDPHTRLRKSECFVCFECIEDCPRDALSFRLLPNRRHERATPPLKARRAAMTTLLGAAGFAMLRRSGAATANRSHKVIRPPGSVEEGEFLRRCIKCDQCIRVCPTNVLQPALHESGFEGLWTPILNMKTGFCELNCTLCGSVCPTGAIQRISIEEKTGTGAQAGKGPVKLGTAFYDRGRCLPWAMDTPCVVCEEVCPVSPKAIYSREVTVRRRDGDTVTLRRPYVDPALCIGCGICQHVCPVEDLAAIRVSPIGETRSPERGLLLDGGDRVNLLEMTKQKETQ